MAVAVPDDVAEEVAVRDAVVVAVEVNELDTDEVALEVAVVDAVVVKDVVPVVVPVVVTVVFEHPLKEPSM